PPARKARTPSATMNAHSPAHMAAKESCARTSGRLCAAWPSAPARSRKEKRLATTRLSQTGAALGTRFRCPVRRRPVAHGDEPAVRRGDGAALCHDPAVATTLAGTGIPVWGDPRAGDNPPVLEGEV